MKRAGFTMIELIFVIVILGILAAVAIPKLAATRDDAKASTALTNISTAINDIGSYYTASGILDLTQTNVAIAGDCFTVTANDADGDGNNDGIVVAGSAADANHCPAAVAMATTKKLIATHTFGGSSVTY